MRLRQFPVPATLVAGLSALICAAGLAQDAELVDLPEPAPQPQVSASLPESGGDTMMSFFGGSGGELVRLFDGMSASLGLAGIYDSNVRRAAGGFGASSGDDFIINVTPTLHYANPGTDWTVSATGGVNYTEFLSNSSLGGLGGNASVGLAYDGGKINLATTLGVAREVGSNRSYDSNYVERDVFSFGLNGSYRVSPKTSLEGSYSYRWDDPTEDYGGTSSTILSFSAMWRYSPVLRFGPGVRFSHYTGDIQADRDTVGPTLRADYQVTSKVAINSEAGMDFVSFGGPGGASDEFFHARLGATYRVSPVWLLNASVFRDARADSSLAGTYREILSTRFSVIRVIRRASCEVGVSLDRENRVTTSGNPVANGDRDYLVFDAALNVPVFNERTSAGIFYRYREDRRDGGGSWDGYQIGVSLRTQF